MTKLVPLQVLCRALPLLLLIGLASCSSAGPTPTEPPPEPPTSTLAAAVETTSAAPTDTPVPPTATPAPDPTPSPTAANNEPESLDRSGNPDLDFAQVQFVQATQTGENTWRFDVTVRHNDQGWDHYADLWRVVDPEGNVLGERVLLHPHDTEQPFTRSQSGIEIPPAVTQVIVQAKCNVHGFGGQEVLVDLTANKGKNFEVVRNE